MLQFDFQGIEQTEPIILNPSIVEYAKNCNLNEVKRLVNNNANINEKGEYGNTALECACDNWHFEMVKFLVKHNALINEKSTNGWTALMRSCATEGNASCSSWFYDCPILVKYLIKHGALVNEGTTIEGCTALMFASRRKYKTVKCLIKYGALLKTKSYAVYKYTTAIKTAQQHNNFKVVKYLQNIVLKRIKSEAF